MFPVERKLCEESTAFDLMLLVSLKRRINKVYFEKRVKRLEFRLQEMLKSFHGVCKDT